MGKLGIAGLGAAAVLSLERTAAAGKKISVPLEKVSALKAVGGWTVVSLKKGSLKLLVIRAGEDKLAAVSPVCSHQKCTVEYRKSWKEIRCPCHGSRFNPWGYVKNGPATKNLKKYPAWLEENNACFLV